MPSHAARVSGRRRSGRALVVFAAVTCVLSVGVAVARTTTAAARPTDRTTREPSIAPTPPPVTNRVNPEARRPAGPRPLPTDHPLAGRRRGALPSPTAPPTGPRPARLSLRLGLDGVLTGTGLPHSAEILIYVDGTACGIAPTDPQGALATDITECLVVACLLAPTVEVRHRGHALASVSRDAGPFLRRLQRTACRFSGLAGDLLGEPAGRDPLAGRDEPQEPRPPRPVP